VTRISGHEVEVPQRIGRQHDAERLDHKKPGALASSLQMPLVDPSLTSANVVAPAALAALPPTVRSQRWPLAETTAEASCRK